MIPYLFPSRSPQGHGVTGSRDQLSHSSVNLIDSNQQEYQDYQNKIELLQSRISAYERMTVDLERRLEDQAQQCLRAEKESSILNARWSERCEEISKEVEIWKARCQKEEEKGDSVRKHLSRTERELYSILQRKHEFMRGAAAPSSAAASPSVAGGAFELPISQMYSVNNSKNSSSNQPKSSPLKKDSSNRAMITSLNEFLGLK